MGSSGILGVDFYYRGTSILNFTIFHYNIIHTSLEYMQKG